MSADPTAQSIAAAQAAFRAALARADSAQAAFGALHDLAGALIGVRLFTVMTVDMTAMLARRAYTSDPVSYPTSGTKPVEMNAWFEVVHGRQQSFVENTLIGIARVFPDHELIGSLGCGSVLNLPVICRGELVATVNLLDAERFFTPERVALAERELALPALAAMLLQRCLQAPAG